MRNWINVRLYGKENRKIDITPILLGPIPAKAIEYVLKALVCVSVCVCLSVCDHDN